MIRHQVPSYSQHIRITNKNWRKKSCGVVSLAMLISHFNGSAIPDQLLESGIGGNAYLPEIGWKHRGLVELAQKHGFNGANFDWAPLENEAAFQNLLHALADKPILASVYRNFRPKEGGHLVVITGFDSNKIFYNDPDAPHEALVPQTISKEDFLAGWKKRVIIINPFK